MLWRVELPLLEQIIQKLRYSFHYILTIQIYKSKDVYLPIVPCDDTQQIAY